MSSERAFKHIIRIANTDLDGSQLAPYALSKIKGVGYNFALAICRVLGIDPNLRLGYLDEETIKRIEEIIRDPSSFKIPSWYFNRRKALETGVDEHLVGSELILVVRGDIEREMRTKSWRGFRHSLGLKVRGQRTATTGRTGVTVGVRKKRESAAGGKKS
ncbi:MAG: 30S ribosomal protein S13 [Sulfolobales archaeon]